MDLSEDKRTILNSLSLGNAYIITGSAGTGKTVFGCLVGDKFASSIAPWQKVLYITYSKLARRQISESVQKLIQAGILSKTISKQIVVQNYHSLWWELICGHKGFLGISPEPMLLTENETTHKAEEILDILCKQKVIPKYFITKQQKLHKDRLATLIDTLRGQSLIYHKWGADNFGKNGELFINESSFLHHASELIRKRNKSGDFSHDETVYWAEYLFAKHPNYLHLFRLTYPVIILDEFQDTDAAQWEIIKRISPNTIVAMGDAAQTIHKWRGADPERFFQFETHAKANDKYDSFSRFNLTVRHRAETNMSDINSITWTEVSEVNDFMTKNLSKKSVKIKTKTLALSGISKKLSVGILCRDNQLADDLVAFIRQKNEFKNGRSLNKLQCYRVGSSHSPFEKAREICFELFCKNPSIETIANNLIQKVFFPCDVESCTSRSKKEHLISRWQKSSGIKNAIPSSYSGRIRRFVSLCIDVESQQNSFADKITLACLSFVAQGLAKNGDINSSSETIRTVIDKLIMQYENASSQYIPINNQISVMTIHQSKGREFDLVIIPWFSSIHWDYANGPKYWDLTNEESQNLFHTACTRAKKQVVVLYPKGSCAITRGT